MSKTDIITQARLKELLHYDPLTGLFTRLTYQSSNARIGDIAGHKDQNGYIRIGIDGVSYKAHRLAFMDRLGWMPVEVDHDNHIRHDNRWKNLNASSDPENKKNQTLYSNNTSGHCGVWWDEKRKKWLAYITVNKKHINLGRFTHKSDAIAARQTADIKYAFHENHGKDKSCQKYQGYS